MEPRRDLLDAKEVGVWRKAGANEVVVGVLGDLAEMEVFVGFLVVLAEMWVTGEVVVA